MMNINFNIISYCKNAFLMQFFKKFLNIFATVRMIYDIY